MAEELKVLLDAESNLSEVFTKEGISASALKTQLHGLAEDALGALIDFSKEGVAATLDLAEQQRDLATVTGTSAHEAGVLIQALDDAGISSDTLTTAAKKLSAEGLSLNADNLRTLRAEYQSITDPVDRAQFATENFGRAAGPEMQKALNLSNQAFEELIEGAEGSALALGDDAVQAARDYEIAQDNMADAIQSAQVIIGQELIPVLTDLTTLASDNLVPIIKEAAETFGTAKIAAEQLAFILNYFSTQQQLVTEGQEISNEQMRQASSITSLYGVDLEKLNDGMSEAEKQAQLQALAVDALTQSTETATTAEGNASAAYITSSTQLGILASNTWDVVTATQENVTITNEAKDVYGFAEQQLRTLNVTEGERLALENALKIASGEMTVEELQRQNAVINLTQALNAGSITHQEYLDGLNEIATDGEVTSLTLGNVGTAIQTTGGKAAEAADQVGGYNDKLGEVPDNVGTTITTTYVSVGTPPPIMNSEGVTSLGGGRASGGPVSAGVPYVVGEEGPEWFVPNSSGTIIPNSQLQAVGGGGGGNVINFYYSPMLSLGDRVELETVVKPMFERLGFVVR